MVACSYDAALELYQLMITKAKVDSRKRCLLVITDNEGWTVLHYAACHHSDPAVLELLIREHPLALCATDSMHGRNPLQWATNIPAPFTSLLTDATNALASSDYTALAARVHGYPRSPSYAARIAVCIAVRTTLLLCRKTVHPTCPSRRTRNLSTSAWPRASVQGRLERHPRVRVEAERRSKCRRQLCL